MTVTEVRIVQRETHFDRKKWHKDARPFSEVFITADGRTFYSRLFHPIEDTPHARAAQIQDFLRRQGRPLPEAHSGH